MSCIKQLSGNVSVGATVGEEDVNVGKLERVVRQRVNEGWMQIAKVKRFDNVREGARRRRGKRRKRRKKKMKRHEY